MITTNWNKSKYEKNNHTISEVFSEIIKQLSNRPILIVGFIEMFEYTVMIVYIYLWTPLLLSLDSNTNIGCAFLSFTLSIMIYAKVFEYSVLIKGKDLYEAISLVMLIQSSSLIIAYFTDIFVVRLICFLLLNGSFGFVLPVISTLKSKFLREETRTLLMGVYKTPTYLLSIMVIIASFFMQIDKVSLYFIL